MIVIARMTDGLRFFMQEAKSGQKAADPEVSMDFYTGFARTLTWRPKQALRALFWHVTGRRLRAKNILRHGASSAPHAYQLWIETVERADEIAVATPAIMRAWAYRPLISILFPWSAQTDACYATALRSLQKQSYPEWEAILPAGASTSALETLDQTRIVQIPSGGWDTATMLRELASAAHGEFLLILSPGITLPTSALFRYVEELQKCPDATILFGDHDRMDSRGTRSTPWFKPQWNAEMFLGQDYISQACLVRTKDVGHIAYLEPAIAPAAVYSLLLKASSTKDASIVHVPHVLAHLSSERSNEANLAPRTAAVSRHINPSGGKAIQGPHDLVRVQWPLPNPNPLVSIIIPTRDRVDLLQTCIESLKNFTTWSNYEIIVVDNQSTEISTKAYFKKLTEFKNTRVLDYNRPYNYSAINNHAARQARGSYICLLNNDTEIIEPNWLHAMMRQAARTSVGAVGAKLLYDDGSIQHAGVVIGMGQAAGHAHRFQKPYERGYFDQVDLTRFVSAVTAACLVVQKDKFDAVGGLDEHELAVAYNDVDLCLKLQKAGWFNVYEPAATLIHHESKSRGNDFSPEHLQRYLKELSVFQKRWETIETVDPSHHPCLDRSQETYVLNF